MTPDGALTAIIARLTAAGLTPARSPLGVSKASQQRINRSFSVLPRGLAPSANPGRGKPNVAGLRVEQTFRVELGHQIKPGDHQEAPSQALQDIQRAFKYISANGTTLTQQGAILFSPATHTYDGGGAFLITDFTLRVTYEMSLEI